MFTRCGGGDSERPSAAYGDNRPRTSPGPVLESGGFSEQVQKRTIPSHPDSVRCSPRLCRGLLRSSLGPSKVPGWNPYPGFYAGSRRPAGTILPFRPSKSQKRSTNLKYLSNNNTSAPSQAGTGKGGKARGRGKGGGKGGRARGRGGRGRGAAPESRGRGGRGSASGLPSPVEPPPSEGGERGAMGLALASFALQVRLSSDRESDPTWGGRLLVAPIQNTPIRKNRKLGRILQSRYKRTWNHSIGII